MRDGALKWGLRLLEIVLFVSPFLIAFGTHNWDIKAAVLPSDAEMEQIKEDVTGTLFGGGSAGAPNLTFTPPSPPYGQEITIPVTFKSPFQFSMRITDISGRVSFGADTYQLRLEDETVYIGTLENKNFNVIAEKTTESGVENVVITFEFYGLTVQQQIGAMLGGS